MSIRLSEERYLSLWGLVRKKLLLAAKLDPPMPEKLDLYHKPSRMIFGASTHNYRCEPMPEYDIQSLENELGIKFPINFRTYLSICGFNSGGPGYGIIEDRITINSIENLKTDCPIEPRRGIGWDINDGEELGQDEYSFKSADVKKGTLDIGTSGNPCIHLLVINGDTQGDVFIYTGDMIQYMHSFETWYTAWLDEILTELQSGLARERFDNQLNSK